MENLKKILALLTDPSVSWLALGLIAGKLFQ